MNLGTLSSNVTNVCFDLYSRDLYIRMLRLLTFSLYCVLSLHV